MVRLYVVSSLNYGLELRECDALKLLIHGPECSVFAPALAYNRYGFAAWGEEEIACLAVYYLDWHNHGGFAVGASVDVPSGRAELTLHRPDVASQRRVVTESRTRNRELRYRDSKNDSFQVRVHFLSRLDSMTFA